MKVNSAKKLREKVTMAILTDLSTTRPGKVLFESLLQHDLDCHDVSEDYHSTQIMKAVINKYITMRLLRYGQEYTLNVIKAKSLGKRQQLNKAVLFSGL